MRLSVKSLRQLVKEELSAQAPPNAPLGQYAWPKERNLPVNEPDTQLEIELLQAISKSIKDQKQPLPKEYVDTLKDLLDKGYYNKVIKRPSVDFVYRGMSVDKNYLESLGIDTMSGYGKLDKNFKFAPKSGASSWTKDIDVALEFSLRNITNKNFAVIMEAHVNSNSFIDYKEFYDIGTDTKSFRKEREILGVGDINVKSISFSDKMAFLRDNRVFYKLLNFVT